MSGGEEHAYHLAHMPRTLDAWTKCADDGCNWQVPLPQSRCWQHGGEDGPARKSDVWGDDVYHFSITEETVEG